MAKKNNLKVLFYVYPSAFQNPGGGEMQLLMTKKYLEKKGVYVKLFDQWTDKFDDYDILHTFGSVKDCLGLMQSAKNKKIKLALSTIFWSTFTRTLYSEGSMSHKLGLSLRHCAKVCTPFLPSARKKMFQLSDILLPNSQSEADQVSRFFQIPKNKFHVVPNGVEERFSQGNRNEFVKKHGIEDFVLCVGRIEPRKNQLNLIKAMQDIDAPLVIVGDPVSDYQWYYEKCKKEAGKNVHFVGNIAHNSSMLVSAYHACSVFCLAGWFETPGLAALEAALAGAPVVVTAHGSTKDYFNELALYIEPHKVNDISEKIKSALNNKKNMILSDYVKQYYLWDNVAEQTLNGYEKILNT